MGESVGADAERDARTHVSADMIQRDAPAPEHVGAMGDSRPGGDQTLEIIGVRPMNPGMVVQEDAVADDGALG